MREKIINFILIMFGVLLGTGATYIVLADPFSVKSKTTVSDNGVVTNVINSDKTVVVDNTGISTAVSKVYDAVVLVKNYKNKTLQGTGSGFVYKTDDKYGYIMTNQHVVDSSTSLKVLMSDGNEVDAKLLGGEAYLDIAIIRIPVKNVIKVASIGKTSSLKLGDNVFAIGSPVGETYYNSITSGVISGIDREVTVSVKYTNDWVMRVIQIDAAINPGNSGGPLLNSNGEVIGVNSMKLVDSQIEGMGFSIKIEDAMAHITELEKGETIERPVLGIEYTDISSTQLLSRYGISIDDDVTYGVVIINTVSDTAASTAKLEKGDIIIKLGNEKVTNSAYLKYILYKHNVGEKIKLTYLRNGKEYTAEATLTKNK